MKLIQEGPQNARIVVVGEAPGQIEAARGLPFQGGSGDILNELLEGIGLVRSEVFITNICHERPPNNDFDWFFIPEHFEAHYKPGVLQLKADLERIQPNIVVALGNEALRVLTGKTGIADWRGSILECKLVPGLKVLPTYHPALSLRVYEFKHIINFDFGRLAREHQTREIVRPTRYPHLDPEPAERERLISEMVSSEFLAIDIETITTSDGKWLLDCVGFSDRPERALVIPVRGPADYLDIRILCSCAAKKIFQNGAFDITVLREQGIEVKNYFYDTMIGHHTLYMESATGSEEVAMDRSGGKKKIQAFAKGLAFQTSIYTDEPYYKADGKISREIGDQRLHWLYNARDAFITREIFDRQQEELGFQRELVDIAMQEQHLYLEAMWRGIAIDQKARSELIAEAERKRDQAQARLDELAGYPVNVKSGDQVGKLLFEQRGMRPVKRTDAGKASTDADSLAALSIQTGDPALRAILDVREQRQLLENFLYRELPGDGRMRCWFDVTGTRTGRLASRESIFGTGTNLQNQPEYVRRMYVPDPGNVFVYRDYSQAEARVVAYLARCHGLIELFENPERDIHTENAARIFGKSLSDVLPSERYLAKRTVHAANYGMGPHRFMEVVNGDYDSTGIKIDLGRATRLLDAYFLLYPEIQSNFWRSIESELRQSLQLTTPWNRTRTFYGRWSDKFLREAYSFKPQSTVGDLCRRACVAIHQNPSAGQWVLNVHDSILVQCPESASVQVAQEMERLMAIPITVNGQTFTIPTDCKIGHNWGEYHADHNPRGLKKVKL